MYYNAVSSVQKATVTIVGSTSNDVSSTILSRASGIIISSDGLVLTTRHSVESESSYTVTTNDGQEYSVSDVRRDPLHDLAVLQIRDES